MPSPPSTARPDARRQRRRASSRRRGLSQRPQQPPDADDRDRRRHRDRAVHGCRRHGLHRAGPGLFVIYGICGVFVFLILRALGELVLHRPASGSFVSYAREFFGEKAAFVAGWMYFLNWAMAAIVDTTAIANYCHYWTAFQAHPAVDARADRAGGGGVDEPDLGQALRRAGVLGRADQGAGADDVPGRRHRLSGRPLQGRRPDTGPSLWDSHGGFLPTGLLPAGARHLGGDIRLRRSRIGRHRGRGNGEPGESHAARDQLGDRPDRGLLLSGRPPAGSAAPLHRLQSTARARSSPSSPKSVSAARAR